MERVALTLLAEKGMAEQYARIVLPSIVLPFHPQILAISGAFAAGQLLHNLIGRNSEASRLLVQKANRHVT